MRALGAVEAVELDVVGGHVAFFPHAGGVDDNEGFALLFEAHVDAVARGAGDFGNDDAMRIAFVEAGDGVDQGALAGVSLADDRQHHLRGGQFGGSVGKIDVLADGGQDLVEIADVERRDADGRAQTQPREIAQGRVGLGAVGLVGDQNGLDPVGGEAMRRSPHPRWSDRSDNPRAAAPASPATSPVRSAVGCVFGQLIGIDESVPPVSISSTNRPSTFERIGHAVARDAGAVLDNADASTGQGVEQTALSDVGPTDDGDDGHGGHGIPVPPNGDSQRQCRDKGDLLHVDRHAVLSG